MIFIFFFFLLFENGNTVFVQIYYLLQKIKIVSLGWNLALRLIRIYIIQWWCSFFLFLTRSIIFSGNSNLFQNIKIVFWNRNAEPRLIWICKNRWSFSFFSFFIGYTLFRSKDLPLLPFFWSKNSKLLV